MKKASNGFTIIEILVTIAIIGILSTIGVFSFSSIQSGSRNAQRSSKVTVIAEALEKYYSQNGEYPTCAAMTSGNVTTNVLVGIDPNALITPSGNSIVCNAPTSDTFGYVGGGSSYTLEYRDESTGVTYY
jgi:prepilin-type N-terminal cleavage/methylation domain-containing protein